MNVTEYFEAALHKHGYESDSAQVNAVARLQRYSDEWAEYEMHRANPLRRLMSHTEPPSGIYLWSGVGRGKTFLMDCFFSVVPGAGADTRALS